MKSNKSIVDIFNDISKAINLKNETTESIAPIDMADQIYAIKNNTLWSANGYKKIQDIGYDNPDDLVSDVGNLVESIYVFGQDAEINNIISTWDINETGLTPEGKPKWDVNTMPFSGCQCLFFPYVETKNLKNADYLFGDCYAIAYPKLNFSNTTSMCWTFVSCALLTNIPEFNTQNVTLMDGIFNGCAALKTIPLLNTSKVQSIGFGFNGCTSLEVVPALDFTNVSEANLIFSGCTSLKEIHIKNINVDLDISSTILEHDALVELIGNLKQQSAGTTKTLTLGTVLSAKLNDTEKQVAKNKGWTIA